MHLAHARTRPCSGMAISCGDLISVCRVHFLRRVISPQGSAGGRHESGGCTPTPPPDTSLEPHLLRWTITGSPAGHDGSCRHSWLHSWLRLPIGCQGALTHTVCFLCFLFALLCCSIVSGNFCQNDWMWWFEMQMRVPCRGCEKKEKRKKSVFFAEEWERWREGETLGESQQFKKLS